MNRQRLCKEISFFLIVTFILPVCGCGCIGGIFTTLLPTFMRKSLTPRTTYQSTDYVGPGDRGTDLLCIHSNDSIGHRSIDFSGVRNNKMPQTDTKIRISSWQGNKIASGQNVRIDAEPVVDLKSDGTYSSLSGQVRLKGNSQ